MPATSTISERSGLGSDLRRQRGEHTTDFRRVSERLQPSQCAAKIASTERLAALLHQGGQSSNQAPHFRAVAH